jgi:hypothetical protein
MRCARDERGGRWPARGCGCVGGRQPVPRVTVRTRRGHRGLASVRARGRSSSTSNSGGDEDARGVNGFFGRASAVDVRRNARPQATTYALTSSPWPALQ